MRFPSRQEQIKCIEGKLADFSVNKRRLVGVKDSKARRVLALQIVASLRREDYYRHAYERDAIPQRADPHNRLFSPEKAVGLHVKAGDIDEASWLVFLMTHFGKPSGTGWTRLKDIYGRLGEGEIWNWNTISAEPQSFDRWLAQNWQSIGGKFGNHRKYESIRPDSNRSTARAVLHYIQMIGNNGHQAYFDGILVNQPNDPFGVLFDNLEVPSFGRLAKFDYLMMLSRYQIINMRPQSAHLEGSTGPAKGVRLLFFGAKQNKVKASDLQLMLSDLDETLNVGMCVLEDALCNWQKSPGKFTPFNG